ncbi:PHP domain-containing protein [Parabacteroides chinchillae]|uniref:Polymerase/histidinol phosphatase N-terminal domain-containing protein n=1 Tax=Parabacteroides chinchillae TaxID=871327 RepID=A0A8G2BUH5_9BACT|nr:PHP domain-containing protein [Parabacteroides chinchillae]SEF55308.1 hypothetical protein SAMN05444001_102217 [Parabacteroides chinchillae]
MNRYKVDLHIHTCLSPCGSLDMSPQVIVETALSRGLDAIAVTDHNSTLQCPEVQALGKELGLKVFPGVEVTTREEAHCLILFPSEDARAAFQHYLDLHLPPIPNDTERFGDQVWVNRRDEIVGEMPYLLLSALDQSINQITAKAKALRCLVVAAHIERPSFSLISQLGFIDPAISLNAVEYNDKLRFKVLLNQHSYLHEYVCYSASDAHYPGQIGTKPSLWQTEYLTFNDLRKTYAGDKDYSLSASGQTDEIA